MNYYFDGWEHYCLYSDKSYVLRDLNDLKKDVSKNLKILTKDKD